MSRPWLVEPTDEMRRWAHTLEHLLRPGSLLGTALVTPIAHVANGSLFFQTYLYAVFHRSLVARLGHAVLMPLIVLTALTAVAMWSPLATWLLTGAMVVFHARVAVRHGIGLAGLLTAVVFVALAAVATAIAGVWPAQIGHPALWMVALGIGQTLSHAWEDHVPPRVSGSSDWVQTATFFARTPLRSVARAALMLPAGLINELWASWRLLPVLVLDALWSCGYQRERASELHAIVEEAWRRGNPAIDFVGSGGATCGPYP